MKLTISLDAARRAELLRDLMTFRAIPRDDEVSFLTALALEKERCKRMLDTILATLARGQGELVQDSEIADAIDRLKPVHDAAQVRQTERLAR